MEIVNKRDMITVMCSTSSVAREINTLTSIGVTAIALAEAMAFRHVTTAAAALQCVPVACVCYEGLSR